MWSVDTTTLALRCRQGASTPSRWRAPHAGVRLIGAVLLEANDEWTTQTRYSRWVRAEVRRPVATATTPDSMVALTNPVFLSSR